MKTKPELLKEIEDILVVVRQGLAMHGGNVEVVDLDMETGQVFVRLQGACVGCPLSDMTLKSGIEEALLGMIPELKEVINVDATPATEPAAE